MAKKNRIIYTSYDDGTPCWKLVEDSVSAWADRCGAKIVNLPKPENYQPQWVIFDAFRKSIESGVDEAAWIDSDVWVQPDAPNIFEDIPMRFYFCQPDPPKRINPNMRKLWLKGVTHNPRPYLVSALVMWTPDRVGKMLEWFEKELVRKKRRFRKNQGDQELLTVAAQETETFTSYFPAYYHKMSKWLRPETPFMHAAGRRKGGKIAKCKRFASRRKDLK